MQALKVKVAMITDLTINLGKTVVVNGKELALFLLQDGQIRAVENRCPHKGGPLSEGMVSGEVVFCPLHDWKISLCDGGVQEPDSGCIQTYTVTIEGSEIYLSL